MKGGEYYVYPVSAVLKYDNILKHANKVSLKEPKEESTQYADCKCSILEHFVPIKTVWDTL